MSALQWAVLILSVLIVVAVVVISRRDREPAEPRRDRPQPPPERETAPELVAPSVGNEQLEIFGQPAASEVADEVADDLPPAPPEPPAIAPPPPPPARPITGRVLSQTPPEPPPYRPSIVTPTAPRPVVTPSLVTPTPRDEPAPPATAEDRPSPSPSPGSSFDEFGVGRPRRRSLPPTLDTPSSSESPAAPAAPPEPPPPKLPPWARSAARPAAPVGDSPAATPPKVEQKIVALLIVEREGGVIAGAKLHAALGAQNLSYGAKQIYHRYARRGGLPTDPPQEPVFSVASLVKPGFLVPGEAAGFSTPGLQIFMVLPGPVKPLNALHDMLATSQALARALNAEVYDGKKQPLSSETMRTLQADVEAWARLAHL